MDTPRPQRRVGDRDSCRTHWHHRAEQRASLRTRHPSSRSPPPPRSRNVTASRSRQLDGRRPFS